MQSETSSREVNSILEAIRTKRIEHREYVNAREWLYAHATYAQPGTPILLLGPSRAGKSEVAKTVSNMLNRNDHAKQSRLLFTEAANPDRSHFSMKHLTLRLLTEIEHPMFGFHTRDEQADRTFYSPRRSSTEPILRLALEEAIKSRGIRWIFVDEAHHIVRTYKSQTAKNHLDSIKSLGNTSKVIQVWVGGYELIINGFSSTHLNGRMRIHHFKRYGSSPEDVDEFVAALASLSVELPFALGKSLLDIAGHLQAYTFGCVGAVVTWTHAALIQMMIKKDQYLKPEHFSATRFQLQLESLAEEIKLGEELLKHVDIVEDACEVPSEIAETICIARRKRRPRGFQRLPKRDRVGQI